MSFQVVNGAALACPMGDSPSTLTVLPANRTQTASQPEATIQDFLPMTNIMPFGMCMSPANPQVAAATAAAMGVLTPQPCLPSIVAPWSPGALTVMIASLPALDNLSICNCLWGGVITITQPGQQTVQIP